MSSEDVLSVDDEPVLKGATTADEKPSCLRRAADGVERGISEGTARVARFVTKRPWTTIVLAVVVAPSGSRPGRRGQVAETRAR